MAQTSPVLAVKRPLTVSKTSVEPVADSDKRWTSLIYSYAGPRLLRSPPGAWALRLRTRRGAT